MGKERSPREIVEAAKQSRCESIAYTYTEPTIFMEYALDIAKLAIKSALNNIFVTNGYMTGKALKQMAPYLHAANIDLKSLSDEFYQDICGARLEPILESIKLHKKLGIWTEVTTLIIPNVNDSEESLTQIAEFLSDLGEEIPWHASRFYPAYKLIDLPPTPLETLRKAKEIGEEAGLRYVYQGNVPGERENTYCYSCGKLLIERDGYKIRAKQVIDSRCPRCGTKIDGIWAVNAVE